MWVRFIPRLVDWRRVCLCCGAVLRDGNKKQFCAAQTCCRAAQALLKFAGGKAREIKVGVLVVEDGDFRFSGAIKYRTGHWKKFEWQHVEDALKTLARN